jgi:hypothetical protein
MANVTVKEKYLVLGNVSYFRGHAESIELGSIGEKRNHLLKANYLEVEDRLLIPENKIVQATVVDIDFTRTSKVDFGAKVPAFESGIPAQLDGGVSYNRMQSGDLKLIKFSVPNNDIKRILNNSPELLKSLKYWGDRARIVHQVFIVMKAKLATEIEKGANVKVALGYGGLEAELGIGMGGSGTTKVNFSKGTCFAYLMAKLRWDAKKKSDWTTIVDLDNDTHGVG